MESFIGTIMPVGFNFAPRGWALCQGQLLQIAQYSALFSLIGTTYGGNGQTTFALPDLRGRTLVGQGTGIGLQPVMPGDMLGAPNATMTVNGNAMVTIDAAHLPKHDHPVTISADQFTMTSTLKATTTAGTSVPAEGSTLGSGGGGPGAANIYVGGGVTPDVSLNAGSVTTKMAGQMNTTTGQNAGGGGAFPAPVTATGSVSVMQPSLGINYVICLEGIFPSRN
jgi:microcystin-dependent protein